MLSSGADSLCGHEVLSARVHLSSSQLCCCLFISVSHPDLGSKRLRCEFCGKDDYARRFKRSKRFCSMACAKRYNVGCSRHVRLFPSKNGSGGYVKKRKVVPGKRSWLRDQQGRVSTGPIQRTKEVRSSLSVVEISCLKLHLRWRAKPLVEEKNAVVGNQLEVKVWVSAQQEQNEWKKNGDVVCMLLCVWRRLLLSVASHQCPVICHISLVSCDVSHLMTSVSCDLSHLMTSVSCDLSHLISVLWSITSHQCSVSCNISSASCDLSHLISVLWSVTSHQHPVICHISSVSLCLLLDMLSPLLLAAKHADSAASVSSQLHRTRPWNLTWHMAAIVLSISEAGSPFAGDFIITGPTHSIVLSFMHGPPLADGWGCG